MGIPLRIVEGLTRGESEPGMMWRFPPGDEPGRDCWRIALPNLRDDLEVWWSTTQRASKPPHQMWEVTGVPPLITVNSSIDIEFWRVVNGESVRDGSYWHGHITNGVIDPP